jgi:hypothetical protein
MPAHCFLLITQPSPSSMHEPPEGIVFVDDTQQEPSSGVPFTSVLLVLLVLGAIGGTAYVYRAQIMAACQAYLRKRDMQVGCPDRLLVWPMGQWYHQLLMITVQGVHVLPMQSCQQHSVHASCLCILGLTQCCRMPLSPHHGMARLCTCLVCVTFVTFWC